MIDQRCGDPACPLCGSIDEWMGNPSADEEPGYVLHFYYPDGEEEAVTLRPYVCPVCQGTQTVFKGFYDGLLSYSTSFEREKCRSCDGSGVVWG